MTIRARLLALLLPTMIAFVTLISIFFYVNWYREIIDGFKAQLRGIVVSGAQTMDPQKISWIDQHLNDPNLEKSELYQRYNQKLARIKEKLPMTNIYIVNLEPVPRGERVILNEPGSEINHTYDGHDQAYAYRQIYLLDASGKHRPGYHDFTEGLEQRSFISKEAFVTPIYESKSGHQGMMTGYAPILDNEGQVVGLLAADLNLKLIDQKLHDAIKVIVVGGLITMLFVILSVYFIANKISKPVQKLKNAALAIAAGDYSENIEAGGPREIVELANTLNTMSECLQENISRLQESSRVRERLYGEYECTLLLQHEMLDNVVQNFNSSIIALRAIKSESSTKPFGLLLRAIEENQNVYFSLAEAKEKGFQGSYQLATGTDLAAFPNLDVQILNAGKELQYSANSMPPPIVWLTEMESFAAEGSDNVPLHPGDLIFLYNQGFDKLFEDRAQILEWFKKVLRHFATEELDLFMTMLKNELNFLAKRHHISHDMHILCIKTIHIPII